MGRSGFVVRITLTAILFSVFLLLLVIRLYHVQINRHTELYSKARTVYTSITTQKGERGRIFDRNGNLLVGNAPCADICADPKLTGDAEKCREMAEFFSYKLDVPSFQIFKRLSTKKNGDKEIRYVLIKKNASLETVKDIEEEIKKLKYNGVFFDNKMMRVYPKNELLANILGFISVDEDKVKPIIGLEKVCDSDCRPTQVKSSYERDRKGRPFSYGKQRMLQERDGNDIYLTISEPIQTIVEEELEVLFNEYQPKAAYAIMANPYTGDILAMVQRPTFNPNDRTLINPEMWRDRIITDVFEPGSTMKGISVSGALDYGVVKPSTRFDCENGRWFYAGKILRDAHGSGILPVSDIIRVSSNIGAAKIAVMLGKKRLYQTLKRFGFGQKTGIPIQPESKGQFRSLKNWDNLSVTRFPIGQGISCTPLQLLRAYCAIANGGSLVKMRLIDREKNPETGEIVYKEVSKGTNVFLRKETRNEIVSMLKLVTQKHGTAEKAAVKGYDVAGKTGTSQKWVDGSYSMSHFNATFVGFVPADNPAFALIVMADEPQKCHYGGIVSAPVFSRIAEKTLRYLNIPPQYEIPDEEQIKEKSGESVRENKQVAETH